MGIVVSQPKEKDLGQFLYLVGEFLQSSIFLIIEKVFCYLLSFHILVTIFWDRNSPKMT